MNNTTNPAVSTSAGLLVMGLPLLIILALGLVTLIGVWKVYVKAGQPGWGCIIPIFNIYCLVKIAGKPWWWLLLYFIPVVNIVVGILVLVGISRNFGQSGVFVLGLIFLPFIFYPILGFGSATYGPGTPPAAAPPVAA